jgi:hypothetical protein
VPLPFHLPSEIPGYEATTSDTGGGAGTLHEVTDHVGGALALLIAQYQDSPLLRGLIGSYVHQIQDVEHGLVQIYQNALSIETAIGVQLDLIGRVVREARDGRTDDDYRRALRVRVLVNKSQGRHEDLIAIVRLFEDMDTSGGTVKVQDLQPARIEVRAEAPAVNEPSEVHKRVRLAKAAGVSLTTITHPEATAGRLFVLGRASAYASTNATTGLSWTGDTARGGALAHALTG